MEMSGNEQDRILAAVAKLIELTQLKVLRWSADTDGVILEVTGDVKGRDVFVAEYEGRLIRVYQLKTVVQGLRRNPDGTRATSTVWRPTLELSQPDNGGWWSFPRVEPIGDLLRAVKYQVSGIDDFVNKLLS